VGAHYRQQCLRTAVGRYFTVYALIPATLVLVGVAYFLASKQGLAIGVLSLVLAAVAMQLCYFLSVVVTVSVDNFEAAKAPSEEFPLPKPDHGNMPLSWRPLSLDASADS
jgi:hypothetical protein